MESAGNSVHILFGGSREAEVAGTFAEAGHRAIVVTSDPGLDAWPSVAVVLLPRIPEAQQAILEVLTMQILVAAVAERTGVDIEDFVFRNSDTKVPASGCRPRGAGLGVGGVTRGARGRPGCGRDETRGPGGDGGPGAGGGRDGGRFGLVGDAGGVGGFVASSAPPISYHPMRTLFGDTRECAMKCRTRIVGSN
ncbi:MAG TPA: hypothetical protein VFQ68_42280 [Streptosporangiaceae bacterium]|nr:hypothetical protein [Streptosporangiaceae bacterium]